MGLSVVHVELSDANAFVESIHRHHGRVAGHRFSIGVRDGDKLVGVAIVGRPVARMTDQVNVVEVTRLCTDGTKNACSFLYSACARAARELGYESIQTFILERESGVSVRAAGWSYSGDSGGGSWSRPSRGREDDHPTEKKSKYVKVLRKESK